MNEELKIKITAEIGDVQKKLQTAKNEISQFTGKAKQDMSDLDKTMANIGSSIGKAMKKIGTSLAVGAAALAGVAVATEEYRQNQAQLNAAFEQANMSASAATGVYRELYKTIGDDDQAVESAANIAMLANNTKEAKQWAELASGVLGTFHDTLQPEAFYEAANETLKLGEATGAFTQMLEQTGVMSVEEFNAALAACTTEEEKQALMLQVSQDAMGKAGAAYDKATKNIQAQREAQIKLKDALAIVGNAVTPVITAFTNFAANALAVVTPYLEKLASAILPSLQAALDVAAAAVEKIFTFISEHTGLLATIAGIILTIVAAIGLYNAIAVIKTGITLVETGAVAALASAYLAQAAAVAAALAPYIAIVAAIAAVIAILVKCYKENEEFRAVVDRVFKAVKEIITTVMETISTIISTVWETIKDIWNSGLGDILQKVMEILGKVVTSFFEKLAIVLEFVSTVFKNISNVIKSNLETARTIVKNVIAIIKGIFTGDFGAVKTAVANIFNAIKDNIKTKLDAAKNIVKSAIDKIKSFFNFSWSLPKLKLPHITIKGKFSLSPPQTPKFSISWYQLGGVFDTPTLFPWAGGIGGLGENGAEAIVPLEKNTQWLDKIADRLAAKQNGIPIILQVDGKTFAEVSIASMNALTRQKGFLGLNLV